MRSFIIFAVAAALGLVEANNMLTPYGGVYKRQAFDPDETTGKGANCAEAFGAGYVECVPQTDLKPRLCINPTLGETCCDSKWGCPSGSFCLVQDLCCPTGLDPKTCATQNDVTLPPDFSVPSATSPGSASTPAPSVHPSSVVSDSPKPSVTSGYGSGNHTGGKPPVVTAAAAHERAGAAAAAAVIGLAAALVL